MVDRSAVIPSANGVRVKLEISTTVAREECLASSRQTSATNSCRERPRVTKDDLHRRSLSPFHLHCASTKAYLWKNAFSAPVTGSTMMIRATFGFLIRAGSSTVAQMLPGRSCSPRTARTSTARRRHAPPAAPAPPASAFPRLTLSGFSFRSALEGVLGRTRRSIRATRLHLLQRTSQSRSAYACPSSSNACPNHPSENS